MAIIEFIVNNSPAQSAGYTPFFLNYFYHPCTLVDVLRDSEETTIENINKFTLRIQREFSRAHFFFIERSNGRRFKLIGGYANRCSIWETRYC